MKCYSKVMLSFDPDENSIYMYCIACDFFEYLGIDFIVEAVLEAESHHTERELPQ